MPDLLLELLSEEIPARMQAKAGDDLMRLVTDALVERGVTYEGAGAYATPRRLALVVTGLPPRQPDAREERKGPRVGAPEGAIQGFLKATGLASLDQAMIESDPKKGAFYVAVIDKPGQPLPALIAEIVPNMIKSFPWPKSMRWGAESLRWVRPLTSILCTFSSEVEEPQVISFQIGGVSARNITQGHRFMAPGDILVKRFDDYTQKLEAAKVMIDPVRRRQVILHDARNLAFAQGLELVEDDALLDEVTGLVEWPVVLMGTFDARFLEVPGEAIQETIQANQKCFVVRDPTTGRLANRFVLIANIEAKDGGAAIIAGNERVIRARLADAKFFWETDQKPLPGYEDAAEKPLDQRLEKIKRSGVIFHDKLGTQGERIKRIAALARELAPLVGADPAKAERGATLAKADLVTEMVGEFPDLQGLMGRYYAQRQGEDPSVAAAIEDHYRPKGPSDRAPSDPVAIAVALADKLDTLMGFWAIDEKPTGSKDPYALRRAALGVIRIALENNLRIRIGSFLAKPFARIMKAISLEEFSKQKAHIETIEDKSSFPFIGSSLIAALASIFSERHLEDANRLSRLTLRMALDLLTFLADRLKVQLREQGARHDLVDAVFALDGQDDLLLIVRQVEALGRFLDTEDGKSLLAGYRRAANILRIEEKKEGASFAGVDPSLLAEPVEKTLYDTLQIAKSAVAASVETEDFEAAMAALAKLRQPVDLFFEGILVNAEDAALRRNRLALLAEIRAATLAVADFSKIESKIEG